MTQAFRDMRYPSGVWAAAAWAAIAGVSAAAGLWLSLGQASPLTASHADGPAAPGAARP
jgi:hypothetical protein